MKHILHKLFAIFTYYECTQQVYVYFAIGEGEEVEQKYVRT